MSQLLLVFLTLQCIYTSFAQITCGNGVLDPLEICDGKAFRHRAKCLESDAPLCHPSCDRVLCHSGTQFLALAASINFTSAQSVCPSVGEGYSLLEVYTGPENREAYKLAFPARVWLALNGTGVWASGKAVGVSFYSRGGPTPGVLGTLLAPNGRWEAVVGEGVAGNVVCRKEFPAMYVGKYYSLLDSHGSVVTNATSGIVYRFLFTGVGLTTADHVFFNDAPGCSFNEIGHSVSVASSIPRAVSQALGVTTGMDINQYLAVLDVGHYTVCYKSYYSSSWTPLEAVGTRLGKLKVTEGPSLLDVRAVQILPQQVQGIPVKAVFLNASRLPMYHRASVRFVSVQRDNQTEAIAACEDLALSNETFPLDTTNGTDGILDRASTSWMPPLRSEWQALCVLYPGSHRMVSIGVLRIKTHILSGANVKAIANRFGGLARGSGLVAGSTATVLVNYTGILKEPRISLLLIDVHLNTCRHDIPAIEKALRDKYDTEFFMMDSLAIDSSTHFIVPLHHRGVEPQGVKADLMLREGHWRLCFQPSRDALWEDITSLAEQVNEIVVHPSRGIGIRNVTAVIDSQRPTFHAPILMTLLGSVLTPFDRVKAMAGEQICEGTIYDGEAVSNESSYISVAVVPSTSPIQKFCYLHGSSLKWRTLSFPCVRPYDESYYTLCVADHVLNSTCVNVTVLDPIVQSIDLMWQWAVPSNATDPVLNVTNSSIVVIEALRPSTLVVKGFGLTLRDSLHWVLGNSSCEQRWAEVFEGYNSTVVPWPTPARLSRVVGGGERAYFNVVLPDIHGPLSLCYRPVGSAVWQESRLTALISQSVLCWWNAGEGWEAVGPSEGRYPFCRFMWRRRSPQSARGFIVTDEHFFYRTSAT